MAVSLTKSLMRPEPSTPGWKDRIIDAADDIPDLDGYVSADAIPIVEYVLTRDPILLYRVARTEEDIIAEVRERFARARKAVANREERIAAREAVVRARHEELRQRARENSVSREG